MEEYDERYGYTTEAISIILDDSEEVVLAVKRCSVGQPAQKHLLNEGAAELKLLLKPLMGLKRKAGSTKAEE